MEPSPRSDEQHSLFEEILSRPLHHIHDLIFSNLDLQSRRSCLMTSRALRKMVLDRIHSTEEEERLHGWLSVKNPLEVPLQHSDPSSAEDVTILVDESGEDSVIFVISEHRVERFIDCKLESTLSWPLGEPINLSLVWLVDGRLMVLGSERFSQVRKLYSIDAVRLEIESCEETDIVYQDLLFMLAHFEVSFSLSRRLNPLPYIKSCKSFADIKPFLNLMRSFDVNPVLCVSVSSLSHLAITCDERETINLKSIPDGRNKWSKQKLDGEVRHIYLSKDDRFCVVLFQKIEDETGISVLDMEQGNVLRRILVQDCCENDEVNQVLLGRNHIYALQASGMLSCINLHERFNIVRRETNGMSMYVDFLGEEQGFVSYAQKKEERNTEDHYLKTQILVMENFRDHVGALSSGQCHKASLATSDDKFIYFVFCCRTRDGVIARYQRQEEDHEQISFFLMNRSIKAYKLYGN